MKLTFPILTLSRGGAQRMLAELANHMAQMGHEVVILMPANGIVEYELACPVLFSAGPALSEDDFPFGDCIVSNYYTTVPVAQRASDQGKGVHVRLALCYEPAFLPDNNLSYSSYSITRNLLVLSRWQQEIVRLNHGIKGRIVPVGVNEEFRNMNMRLAEGRRLVVSAIMRKPEGGFSGHREQEHLLQQLNLVKQACPEVLLYLITPPGEYASSPILQSLLADERYLVRTPSNDIELSYHYNESDIFVSSSTYDTGSLPGLEAMRCGAALVTLYSGGNLEYGVHGHNCMMSYRFENRLAEDIITLVRHKDMREELARKGESDSRGYTWARSAEIFHEELLYILSRQG